MVFEFFIWAMIALLKPSIWVFLILKFLFTVITDQSHLHSLTLT